MTLSRLIALCTILFSLSGCSKEKVSKPKPYQYDIPSNLDRPMPVPKHNPGTEAGVLLGKKLFYDPLLSASNTISCATCHQPDKAFSDGLALSDRGVSGKPLLRHVPQLTNVGWYQHFFWDGGAKTLESLVFGPLTHADEMGQNLKELTAELQADAEYPTMFALAFGEDTVHAAYVARALAQYMRTLVSADSRYDHYVRGEDENTLSPKELKGMRLAQEKCGSCHAFESGKADFFTDFAYHNNGLDSVYAEGEENTWKGRFRITFDSTQIGAYKTPTLRNLPQSAPYMHDGRFATLKEVLDHYSQGVKASPYLDSLLIKADGSRGIAMSQDDKQAILAFLLSLQDTSNSSI